MIDSPSTYFGSSTFPPHPLNLPSRQISRRPQTLPSRLSLQILQHPSCSTTPPLAQISQRRRRARLPRYPLTGTTRHHIIAGNYHQEGEGSSDEREVASVQVFWSRQSRIRTRKGTHVACFVAVLHWNQLGLFYQLDEEWIESSKSREDDVPHVWDDLTQRLHHILQSPLQHLSIPLLESSSPFLHSIPTLAYSINDDSSPFIHPRRPLSHNHYQRLRSPLRNFSTLLLQL